MAIMGCYCAPSTLPQREMSIGEFKAWLKRFDADRDGKLSKQELRRAMNGLHKWFAWWKARDAMNEVDQNGDGMIDKDEIDRFVGYAQQHLNVKIHSS